MSDSRRICQVIKVKPDALDEYKQVHADVWPDVLAALRRAHIVDYSIHYLAPLSLLIAHMRYTGDDYDKDMAGIAADEATRRWWKESFIPGATGSESGPGWWTSAEEVFRFEG